MVSKNVIPAAHKAALIIVAGLMATAVLLGAGKTAIPVLGITAGAILVWYGTRFLRGTAPKTGAFIAYFTPLIAYGVLYEAVHTMMTAVHPGTVDSQLVAIDEALFGVNPILWLHGIGFPTLTDFAYLAYFSYYMGMPVLLVLMFLKDEKKDFEKVLFVMTLGWYAALVSYQLFPALGPQRYLADILPPLTGALPTTAWIQHFLATSLVPEIRDCVPSMHTAITILTLVYAYRDHRGYFFIYLVPGLGLIFATMYTQQHYVIDVLLGVLTAAFLYWAVETIARRSTLFHHSETTHV